MCCNRAHESAKRKFLDRIIGSADLADVADAFSGRHPTIPAYSWSAEASLRGEVIDVEGLIYHESSEIGHFKRRLSYAKRVGQAYHVIMEIEREHRGRDIAKYNYARILRFYDRVGIARVILEAEGEGPVVWSTFGFDFSHSKHRDMLLRILREWNVNPIPDRTSLLAPHVVGIDTVESPELGQEAIYKLLERAREPLPMHLDLRDAGQRDTLRLRGILLAEKEPS